MRTDIPQAIHRKDYTPPNYLVDTVEIGFDLEPVATRVSTRMTIRRHPNASQNTLVLHGEQLTLVQLRVDGKLLGRKAYRQTPLTLEIPNLPAMATLEIETITHPEKNTTLSGLYVSNGNFFTQCEAEGFRRIAYFPDRPDVMAVYTVMLRADKKRYPVLLSNGNLVEEGELGDGRHFAKWEDPFKKPSYLFALVAGKLVCQEERYTLRSGREVLLQVWVEAGNLDKTQHAMVSLKNSIGWDEERFAVTLAAALSLPLQIGAGNAFPARDELILIAAGVIILTMLIAAICLPMLLKGLPQDDEKAVEQERAQASVKASHAAIEAIASTPELEQSVSASLTGVAQVVTEQYHQRITAEKGEDASDAGQEHHLTRHARLIGLRAERDELHRLHDAGEINEETLQQLMRPLDLAEESLR